MALFAAELSAIVVRRNLISRRKLLLRRLLQSILMWRNVQPLRERLVEH
jgi:hypothetical protein